MYSCAGGRENRGPGGAASFASAFTGGNLRKRIGCCRNVSVERVTLPVSVDSGVYGKVAKDSTGNILVGAFTCGNVRKRVKAYRAASVERATPPVSVDSKFVERQPRT